MEKDLARPVSIPVDQVVHAVAAGAMRAIEAHFKPNPDDDNPPKGPAIKGGVEPAGRNWRIEIIAGGLIRLEGLKAIENLNVTPHG